MSMLPLSSNIHSESEIFEAICQGTKMPNFIKPRASSAASNSPPYGCMISPLGKSHMHVRTRNLCLFLLFPTYFIHAWMEQKGCLQPREKHKGHTQTCFPGNTKCLYKFISISTRSNTCYVGVFIRLFQISQNGLSIFFRN